MADVIVTTTVTTFDDCSGSSTRSSFDSGQTYVWVGRHYSGDYRPTGGWRFQVPDTIDPNDITEVKFKATAIVAGGSGSAFVAKVAAKASDTASFANDATNAPWPRGEAAHTAYGSVTWTATSLVDGARQTSPDITTQVVAALNATTASGGYRTIGVYLRGDTGANEVHTLAAIEHATYAEATLEIKVPEPENPTPSVSPVNATSTVSGPTLFERRDNISYDNGLAGYSADRYCDVYLPMGTPPDGGWPVVMYVHGGGFNSGNEDDLQAGGGANLRNDTLSTGTAIVSIRYKLTYWLLDVALGWTRPHMQQDMFAALKWIDTQSTFDLNSSRIIGVGYSAGGHLVLEAACYAEDPNIDDYTASGQGMAPGARPGQQDIFGTGPLGDRYDDFPDLIVTQGRTNVPKMIGVFTFGGAVSLSKIWDDATTTPDLQMNIYFGYKPSDSYIKEAVNEEGDIDAFIVGLAGSIYADRDATPPKFPIGVIYSTGDTSVPVSAGYTPLRSALSTASYRITGDDDKVLNPGVALSRYSYAGSGNNGGHDDLLATYNRPFYLTWLKSTLALTLPSTVTATLTVPTPTWSEESVATGGTAEPDAVTATTSIPSAGWGTDRVPTVVTATSTVPAPAWGAGWALTTVAGTASIGTPTWGAGWVPSVVTVTTAIAAQAGVGGGFTTPAVVAAVAAIPSAAWGAGWVLSSVTATSTIPAPSAVGGGTVSPSTVVTRATIPGPTRGAGWVLSSVTATTTIAAQAGVGGGFTTPATVGAAAAVPATSWGAGWVPPAVTTITAIAAQAGVGGGFTTPTNVAAVSTVSSLTWGATWTATALTTTSTIPAPSATSNASANVAVVNSTSTVPAPVRGAGWTLAVVTATSTVPSAAIAADGAISPAVVAATSTLPGAQWGTGRLVAGTAATTTVPAIAWVSRGAPATVNATTTIPAAGHGYSLTPTAVATTTTVPMPARGAGWVLVGPNAATAIAAQGSVGGGYTTPASVAASAAVTTTTWSAGWIVTGPTATTSIGSPDTAGGLTAYPSKVSAVAAVPGLTWGATWVITSTQALVTVPAPSAVSGSTTTAVAVTALTGVGAATTGSGVATSVVAAVTIIVTPSVDGGAVIRPDVVVGIALVGAPAISGGGLSTATVVTAVTAIGEPSAVTGTAADVQPVAAIAYVMEPTFEYGSVIAVMAVAALVSIGAARPSVLSSLLFSYSDGKTVTDGIIAYFDGVSEKPFDIEYIG